MTKPILFIVHKITSWGIYYSDDNELIDYLNRFFEVKIINWEKTNPKNLRHAVVLIRHPSNYIEKHVKFLNWVRNVETVARKIINSYFLIKRNINKKYLFTLKIPNVHIVPTILLTKREDIQKIKTREIVLKPFMGEGGKNVLRLRKNKIDLQKYRNWLAQDFLNGIFNGEVSTIFINNEYSHSVIKQTPSKNEFKTIWSKFEQFKDNLKLISLSKKVIVKHCPKACYIRIDWIKHNRLWYLSEIELIDPVFYISRLSLFRKKKFLYMFKNMLDQFYV